MKKTPTFKTYFYSLEEITELIQLNSTEKITNITTKEDINHKPLVEIQTVVINQINLD